jgi:hypothetical protein
MKESGRDIREMARELVHIAGGIIDGRLICNSRGQQVVRKDKDLMQDTGGISKGRDREPDNKPPRDDLKDRYRDRRLVPEKIDKDTNEDKDRDVKKPSRRPQVKKSSVEWTAELVMDCCNGKFGEQCEFPGDLKNGQVIICRNRGNPPLICYYGEGGAGYIWSTAEEIASELNAHGIPLPSRPQLARIARIAECVAIHPLDRKDKNQWLGMDVPEDNYHRQVMYSLHHIIERAQGVSEKDFQGQDWIRVECDRVVRTPEADTADIGRNTVRSAS